MLKKGLFRFASLIVFLLLFFLSSGHALANKFQGSMHLELPLSLGEFRENIGHSIIGGGFSFSFGYRPGKSPFILGLSGKYIIYGLDSRREYVYIPEFGEIGFKIEYNYAIFQAHVYLRLQPITKKRVHPYFDLMVGLSDISCHSSIPSEDYDNDYSYEVREKHLGDTVLTYGAGGGFMIKVGASRRRSIKRRAIEHFIDIGAHYTNSNKDAEYLKRGSIILEDDEITLIVYQSPLQMLTFRIGYVINF